MIRPFKGTYPVTQTWGVNQASYAKFGLKGHNGVDYGTPMNTPIIAPHGGTILEVANDPTGYGLYVKIENDQEGSILAHLSRQDVKVGQVVKEGEQIGLSGTTGNSTGSHLHWGYYRKPRNKADGYSGTINPFPYLSENQDDENPLQACLTAHKKAVDDYALLEKEYKAKKEEWTATEKRLIAEKDQAIKDKEVIIGNLQHELDAKQALLKTEQDANAEKRETIKKLEEDVREFNLALSTMQAERDEALAQKVKAENEATGMVAEVTELRQKVLELEGELSSRPIPYKKLYEEAKLEVEKLTEKMDKDMIPYAKHKILKALQQVAYDLDTRLQALK